MAESGEMRRWPQRLHHEVPGWVEAGEVFRVRLRIEDQSPAKLTTAQIGPALLSTAEYYHTHLHWRCLLFLLMPDHVHALVAFPGDKPMATIVGSWKRFVARTLGIRWQKNFFDHRIRHALELKTTWDYILRNPVVKGLATSETAWPWQWHSSPQGREK